MEGEIMESFQEVRFTSNMWSMLLPVILMGADILTGWIQASINGTWDSTKMRKGLFRKSAEIIIIVLAYVVQVAVALPVDIFMFISIYVCIMEGLSVIENLDQAGLPVPGWITRRLKKAMDSMVKDEEEKDGEA
jgi:toxin secretion/phage lysis holin